MALDTPPWRHKGEMEMKKTAQTVLREGAYYTIAAISGRVLEVADYNTDNGAAIQLWNYEGQPWQQWTFEEVLDGQYRIKNRFTGKVADLAMLGVSNGTWLHQWAVSNGASQRWEVIPAADGRVKLRNVLADKVIDLVDMRIDNGARAQIWQDVNGENQLWRLSPVPDRLLKRESPAPMPENKAAKAMTRAQTGKDTAKKSGGKAARRTSKNR